MKALNIKSKLTLRFTIIFGSIWAVASIIIYYASSAYRQEEFYRRLQGRAESIARLLVDVDQVDAELLRKIEAASPVQLPGEKITVYDYLNNEIFSTDLNDTVKINKTIIDNIRLSEEIRWKQQPGEIEILGLLYKGMYDRYIVVAGAYDLYGHRKLQNLRHILLFVFFSSLIIAGVMGRLYAGKALQPISKVIEEVNQIDSTQLHARVSEGNGHDEIATLGITFNHMLSRMEAAFESQKSFIANSSHELRTPMTGILSQVDLTLLKERSSQQYKAALHSIKEEIVKLSDLTSKLLLLTRLDTFNVALEVIRIDSIIWQTIIDIKAYCPDFKANVHLSEDIDDESMLQLKGSESLLKSTFLNLFENAYKYSEHGEVLISIASRDSKLEIKISDKGIGIPEAELARICTPFFRASNASSHKGSGVGLNLVRRIVDIHHGELHIASKEGFGTTVTVVFPLA